MRIMKFALLLDRLKGQLLVKSNRHSILKSINRLSGLSCEHLIKLNSISSPSTIPSSIRIVPAHVVIFEIRDLCGFAIFLLFATTRYFDLVLIPHFRQKPDSCHFLYTIFEDGTAIMGRIFEDCDEIQGLWDDSYGRTPEGMKEERILSVNRNDDVEIDLPQPEKDFYLIRDDMYHVVLTWKQPEMINQECSYYSLNCAKLRTSSPGYEDIC